MVGKLFIDNNDLYTTYGITCEKVEGALALLGVKQNNVVNWQDEHGDDIYLGKPYYESRDINIKCGLVAAGTSQYLSNITNFFNLLTGPGLHYLKVANINKGYMIYLRASSDIMRITKFSGSPVIGKFTLKLNEPHPVKRIFTSTGASISFTIACARMVTIWWGDGTTQNVVGTSTLYSKTFGSSATRFQAIWGNIDSITSLTYTGVTEITD